MAISDWFATWYKNTTIDGHLVDDGLGSVAQGNAIKRVMARMADYFGTGALFEGYIDIDEISPPGDPAANTLRMYASDEGGFPTLHVDDANGVDIEINRDTVHIVRNNSGAQIDEGQAVYITGSNGTFPTVDLADASSAATMPVLGLAMQDIGNNSFGQVINQGDIGGLDTSAFNDGDEVFADTTAGGLTATAPTGADRVQSVGTVVKGGSVGAGIIAVDVGFGYSGYLSGLDQALATTDSPTFAGATVTGNITGGSAGSSFSLLHAANDSFTLVSGGTSNASAQLRLHGSAHTNANDFSLRANTGTTVVGWDHSATTLTILDNASDTLDIAGQTIDLSAAGAVTIQTTGAYNLVLGVNNTAAITIDDATTDVTFAADIDVTSLIKVGGAQVLTVPQSGWSAATGTATRSGFATGSATTQQVAEHLKALIDDLIEHGLIDG